MIRRIALLATLVAISEAFAPQLNFALRANKLSASPSRGSRSLRLAPKAMLADNYYSAMAAATNLLLAVDSDESKVDNLYNGIPATGAVSAPAWALPVFAIGISLVLAVAIPLLLKPGTDAFNEQRNDIGVFSNKDKKY